MPDIHPKLQSALGRDAVTVVELAQVIDLGARAVARWGSEDEYGSRAAAFRRLEDVSSGVCRSEAPVRSGRGLVDSCPARECRDLTGPGASGVLALSGVVVVVGVLVLRLAGLILLLVGCAQASGAGGTKGVAEAPAETQDVPEAPDIGVPLDVAEAPDIRVPLDVAEAPDIGVPLDVCLPDCTERACGSDGCGGSCGTCSAGTACSSAGACACEPSCSGKTCGPDGCGGTCGSCSEPETCNPDGQCQCVPQCSGKTCGSDGCGGTCGECPFGVCLAEEGHCAPCEGTTFEGACKDNINTWCENDYLHAQPCGLEGKQCSWSSSAGYYYCSDSCNDFEDCIEGAFSSLPPGELNWCAVGDWFAEAAGSCMKSYPCGYTTDLITKQIFGEVGSNCLSCFAANGTGSSGFAMTCKSVGAGKVGFSGFFVTIFVPND